MASGTLTHSLSLQNFQIADHSHNHLWFAFCTHVDGWSRRRAGSSAPEQLLNSNLIWWTQYCSLSSRWNVCTCCSVGRGKNEGFSNLDMKSTGREIWGAPQRCKTRLSTYAMLPEWPASHYLIGAEMINALLVDSLVSVEFRIFVWCVDVGYPHLTHVVMYSCLGNEYAHHSCTGRGTALSYSRDPLEFTSVWNLFNVCHDYINFDCVYRYCGFWEHIN